MADAAYDGATDPEPTATPIRTLDALLGQAVALGGDAAALSVGRRKISYRQLAETVARLAGALAEMGVDTGDRVLIALPNCPQLAMTLFAAARRGAVAVLVNPALPMPDLQSVAADTDAHVIVCLEAALVAFEPASGPVEHVIVADLADYYSQPHRQALRLRRAIAKGAVAPAEPDGSVRAWREIVESSTLAEPVDVAPENVAVVVATAGTTGRPRWARLTHANLTAAARLPGVLDGGPDESVLGVLPMFHVYGLQLLLATLWVGARVALLASFDVDSVLQTLEAERVTVVPVVPPMLRSILESPALRRHDLRRVRLTLSVGMPLPMLIRERVERVTSGQVLEAYGATETAGLVMVGGKAVPGMSVRVVTADEAVPSADLTEPGELVVEGPQVFDGYWDEDPRMRGLRRPGSWLTGDMATVTDDLIRVVDRRTDVIGAGVDAVFPSDVEQVLLVLPAIEDCCVVPHATRRRRPMIKALVVPRPTTAPDPEGVRAHAAARLPRRSVPDVVEYVDTLPRSLLGTTRRCELVPPTRAGRDGDHASGVRRLRGTSPK